MFEGRLKALLIVLVAATLVMVARLFELQIVRADHYRQRAERALLLRPKQLPFVRGSILDRTGEVLVRDEPCWDVKIDYSIIAADVEQTPRAVKRSLARWKRAGRYPGAQTDESGHPFVTYWSICGPAVEKNAMALLRYNTTMLHGAFAVKDVHGAPTLVLQANQLAETLDPLEVSRVLSAIAWQADKVEQKLVGTDEN